MSTVEHSHYDNHYTRITIRGDKEYLQLICKYDGVIFREEVLAYEKEEDL